MGAVTNVESGKDRLQNAIRVIHDVVIGNVKDGQAHLSQILVPARILFGIVMRIAIDLDDELCRRTIEIRDGVADDLLTPELETIQLAVGKITPQALFRLGRVAAHFARTILQRCELFG